MKRQKQILEPTFLCKMFFFFFFFDDQNDFYLKQKGIKNMITIQCWFSTTDSIAIIPMKKSTNCSFPLDIFKHASLDYLPSEIHLCYS